MSRIHHTTRLLSCLPLIAVLAAGAGCAHRTGTNNDNGASQEPAVLLFHNESLDQADVYAVIPGAEAIRIGTVLSGRTDTLTVPRDVTASGVNVNIVARLLAQSRQPRTGAIPIRPGDRIEVTLPVDERTLTVLPAREQ